MIGNRLGHFRIVEKLGSGGMGGWAAASVGIAQAAKPKETIPIFPRIGEVSEKAGSGSRRAFRTRKGWLGAGGTLWEKNHARRARLEATGCIIATAGGSKN